MQVIDEWQPLGAICDYVKGAVSMKYLEALELSHCQPRLIPMFKQTERKLLSVFMALLSMSPQLRGAFLK
ncbi:MAG: hypothetical protein AB8B82_14515 [Roseovarius sp.]